MKRKPYTVQEKEILLKSGVIEKIAHSSATYSKEFKLFAVGEYMTGKSPMQIFIEAGIDVNILGREQPQKCLWRWRKIHDKYGANGLLQETRGIGSPSRPSKKVLTTEEKLAKLERENEILKEQAAALIKNLTFFD